MTTSPAPASVDATIRPFTESLPMALLQAREAAMRRFRPMLAEHDLTEQQWRVLRAVASNDTALEIGMIAEATFLLGPSLTRILANLTDRRLVVRQRVSDDARRVAISLTPKGRLLVAAVAPHSEHIYRGIESAFGTAELQALIERLHRLGDALMPDDEETP